MNNKINPVRLHSTAKSIHSALGSAFHYQEQFNDKSEEYSKHLC